MRSPLQLCTLEASDLASAGFNAGSQADWETGLLAAALLTSAAMRKTPAKSLVGIFVSISIMEETAALGILTKRGSTFNEGWVIR